MAQWLLTIFALLAAAGWFFAIRRGRLIRSVNTKLETALHDLQHCSSRLEECQSVAMIGSWEWDIERDRIWWSPQLYRQFGREAIPGGYNYLQYLDFIHPDDRQPMQNAVATTMETGVPYEVEHRIIQPDGTVRYFLGRGALEKGPDGRPVRLFGTGQDITARRAIEEARRDLERRLERIRLEQKLQEAQKMESLAILAGGVAHDFNNILVSVVGNADLALLDLPPDSPVRENLREIQKGAERAAELTRQMLAYAGRGKVLTQPTDLSRLAGEMTELTASSLSKNAKLVYSLNSGLPAVNADQTQLRQVILNLITNANEALPSGKGTITVKTGLIESLDSELSGEDSNLPLNGGPYVFLEVSDDGCGMDEATRSRMFEPFFSTKFTGRGLGLAAIQGIVRSHQGAIRVNTAPGRGTTVRVLFPALAEKVVEAVPASVPRIPSKGLRVLVVDDEESVLATAASLLERSGIVAYRASDGFEAIEVFARQPDAIDVLLLDVTMPGLSGQEVMERLRAMRSNLPVLLSSGYHESEAMIRFSNLGAAGFLQKPYRASELLEKLALAVEPGSRSKARGA